MNPIEWKEARVQQDEIDRYLVNGRNFIDDERLEGLLRDRRAPDTARVRDILSKSMAVEALAAEELADLMFVEDPELWEEMKRTAAAIKRKVYDNRIVTFAPLYLSTKCVNNCVYCGLRASNPGVERAVLSPEAIRAEVEILAGQIGHKRLIAVYGEHPDSGIDYMAESLRTIYDVQVPVRRGKGSIRRVNVNAAPMPISRRFGHLD